MRLLCLKCCLKSGMPLLCVKYLLFAFNIQDTGELVTYGESVMQEIVNGEVEQCL